jgi:hypothetical protein
MNRLNQTEPATFSILRVGLSLGILISLYFKGLPNKKRRLWLDPYF